MSNLITVKQKMEALSVSEAVYNAAQNLNRFEAMLCCIEATSEAVNSIVACTTPCVISKVINDNSYVTLEDEDTAYVDRVKYSEIQADFASLVFNDTSYLDSLTEAKEAYSKMGLTLGKALKIKDLFFFLDEETNSVVGTIIKDDIKGEYFFAFVYIPEKYTAIRSQAYSKVMTFNSLCDSRTFTYGADGSEDTFYLNDKDSDYLENFEVDTCSGTVYKNGKRYVCGELTKFDNGKDRSNPIVRVTLHGKCITLTLHKIVACAAFGYDLNWTVLGRDYGVDHINVNNRDNRCGNLQVVPNAINTKLRFIRNIFNDFVNDFQPEVSSFLTVIKFNF